MMAGHDQDGTDAGVAQRMLRGAAYLPKALHFLLQHPSLLVWMIVPASLQVLLLGMAGWVAWSWVPAVVNGIWAEPTHGLLHTLWWMLVAPLMLCVFIVLAVCVYLVAGLVGAPFYDRMSADVECIVQGREEDDTPWGVMAMDIAVSIAHSLLAIGLWVLMQTLATVLQVLPVFGGVLELTFGITVSSLFLCRELMDGSMSRRRLSFGHKLRLVWQERVLCAGLGSVAGAVLWIPLLNFVTMPACVVAGTLLFGDLEADGAVERSA